MAVMVDRVKGSGVVKIDCDISSESENETEPAKSFHRRLSTNTENICSTSTKEGYLMKQTWSFQRWRRRYFKLKGQKLYYAKDNQAVIFDDIDLTDLSLAECSTKNINNSFQVITPFRSLVLCAESRREMEDWLAALATASSQRRFQETDPQSDFLSGYHHWYATSHARPTYCNVCRETLGGVTSHGLSCEVCKYKVHKRCAIKAINNCKWTTLASVGKDIIEDKDGNIMMPHQWMEGNLPVSAKCMVCEKTCGSVLRLQDWRCLWCRGTVHTACQPLLPLTCPLGPARVSVVPPIALHCIQDEAWDAVKLQASSPLLVFVNSKSGDNQGIKFLRRFKQLLNPAQVFDLISSGPRLGLRLFRHFDPFRILVCSGDGSVGWVLSEIDKLDMHRQCQIAVLPLGTGNDLARVLGWGSSCDDDTHLPQLLEKYERASTKMLDRWSIMTYERTIAMHKLSLTSTHDDGSPQSIAQYGDSLVNQLQILLDSSDSGILLNSAKNLCDTVKEFVVQITKSPCGTTDDSLNSKCDIVQQKINLLLQTLMQDDSVNSNLDSDLTELIESEIKRKSEKVQPQKKEMVLTRANSLKRAIENLVKYTEENDDKPTPSPHYSRHRLRVPESESSGENSPYLNPYFRKSSIESHAYFPSSAFVSEIHRDSICEESDNFLAIPVPKEFSDSRRSSEVQPTVEMIDDTINITINDDKEKHLHEDAASILMNLSSQTVFAASEYPPKNHPQTSNHESNQDDKECSSMLSALSNEEVSVNSEILDQKSFCPRKNSDEDENEHIGHIDSPETSDTFPNSDALQGESLMDDISSMLGHDIFQTMGFDQDSIDTSYTDDTTLFASEHHDVKNPQLAKKQPEDIELQYGFENRAFMSQNIILDCDNRSDDQKIGEPIKYCSLAQFVEGNDIARRSFKRHRTKSVKILRDESNKTRQSTLTEESENHENSPIDVTIESSEMFHPEDTNPVIPEFNVVVEPPSPELSDVRNERTANPLNINCSFGSDIDHISTQSNSTVDLANQNKSYLSPHYSHTSRTSSHYLDVDQEQTNFLKGSPAATRRISCGSLLKPNEAAALAAAMEQAKAKEDKSDKKEDKKPQEKILPIINPLVRLPTWPNVGSGAGFIGQCLLANADALCAAVSPLMDPDETLLEGFVERCVMNNYFGIGIDAKISLDFHHKREEHPEKCRSRAKNYMWYGVLGSKQLLQKTYKNLDKKVQLECDGQRIPLPTLQGIVVLNIQSFMGGTNFWGGSKEDDIFLAPSFDDRIMEVVAVFGSVQMAASRLINLQHHRIAQCNSIQINILGNEGVPVQVDGEAWIQPPGMIRIIHKNRAQMLARNRSLESSLKTWEEKQKHFVLGQMPTGEKSRNSSLVPRPSITLPRHSLVGPLTLNISDKLRQHSFSGQNPLLAHLGTNPTPYLETMPVLGTEVLLSEEEHNLLFNFIECATTLAKWVKILAISNPTMDSDLYNLGLKVDQSLEKIHPNGKLLDGDKLRPEVTKLVHHVKRLFEECYYVLRDKGQNLKLRDDLESKLSVSLANVEMELRKCVLSETAIGTMVYLQPIPDEHSERKNWKGLFWLKFRGKSFSGPNGSAKDVASWGTQEVATWLETLQLAEYTESFIRNDIRGRELLTLARRDLKDLGVTKVGHVKRILQAIKDLNQG